MFVATLHLLTSFCVCECTRSLLGSTPGNNIYEASRRHDHVVEEAKLQDCIAVTKKISADPTRSLGAMMALQSYTEMKQGC